MEQVRDLAMKGNHSVGSLERVQPRLPRGTRRAAAGDLMPPNELARSTGSVFGLLRQKLANWSSRPMRCTCTGPTHFSPDSAPSLRRGLPTLQRGVRSCRADLAHCSRRCCELGWRIGDKGQRARCVTFY